MNLLPTDRVHVRVRQQSRVAPDCVRSAIWVLLLACAAIPLAAQSGRSITMGDAARQAARANGAVDIARTRIAAAEGRETQRRGAMYPEIVAGVQQA